MNWADVMTNNANVSSRDGHARHDSVAQGSAVWASWDPHEVWLTRVRQPRELAARQAANDDTHD